MAIYGALAELAHTAKKVSHHTAKATSLANKAAAAETPNSWRPLHLANAERAWSAGLRDVAVAPKLIRTVSADYSYRSITNLADTGVEAMRTTNGIAFTRGPQAYGMSAAAKLPQTFEVVAQHAWAASTIR